MRRVPQVVLLVEDNLNDELLALRTLKKVQVPLRVDVARDGIQARDYLLNPDIPCPDFVLLDLRLPKMNGLEVLTIIRANSRTKSLPVIIFSSSNQEEDVAACFQSGANSYVSKSVEYPEYTARLVKLAEYWLEINEPYSFARPPLCTSGIGRSIQG